MRWGVIFDLPNKEARLKELEVETARPEFWNNTDNAQKVSKEQADLRSQTARISKLLSAAGDLGVLLEMAVESGDVEVASELSKEISSVELAIREFELERMLSGPHDNYNAILEINAGAGGTEAQDWGDILLRMYLRWAEKRGFRTEIVDVHPGEEAGIKSATVFIEGQHAFGFMRSERGVHRLVRISPFDSNARRHTSFASVQVMPDIDQEIEVEIRDDDLRVDTYRSGGAGGQHINKTDSAVRLTHLPTGIVVACQNERSQHKNKATAMKLLKAKLYELELSKKQDELEKIAGERRKIDFGSQIRSYVMQPYQLVKDLRTDHETGNIQAVLDGDLDPFIESYLMSDEQNTE